MKNHIEEMFKIYKADCNFSEDTIDSFFKNNVKLIEKANKVIEEAFPSEEDQFELYEDLFYTFNDTRSINAIDPYFLVMRYIEEEVINALIDSGFNDSDVFIKASNDNEMFFMVKKTKEEFLSDIVQALERGSFWANTLNEVLESPLIKYFIDNAVFIQE